MTVILRTKNGWLLHNGVNWVQWPEIATEILTFHSNEGLMYHLQELFGLKQERNAKGHFRSTKKKDTNAK